MNKSELFELYEILGLILPGAVFVYGMSQLFPGFISFSFTNNLSAGALGVFVILSYAVGHMVQVGGEYVEIFWRKMRGDPTEWIREGKKQLFTDYQIKKLEQEIPDRLGIDRNQFHLGELNRKQWLNIHKQMYIAVVAAGNGKRLEKFHAIYTMCRGLVAALLLLAIFSLFRFSPETWYVPSLLLVFAGLLFYRMAKFERHAVHELFLQFLQLPKEGTEKKKEKQD